MYLVHFRSVFSLPLSFFLPLIGVAGVFLMITMELGKPWDLSYTDTSSMGLFLLAVKQ